MLKYTNSEMRTLIEEHIHSERDRAGEKDAFIRQLQELVDTAPDDKTRMHVERLMREMDQN